MFDAMIDPTSAPAETQAPPLATRPVALRDLTVGLLANTKTNAAALLDEIAGLLGSREGIADVVRRTKLSITDPVPADLLAELTGSCDVVVAGVGDCGSCSASAIADGLSLEAAGVPAVVVCTEAFTTAADAMAELQGSPGYRYVRIPHPLALLDEDGVRERAERVVGEIVGLLTGPATAAA